MPILIGRQRVVLDGGVKAQIKKAGQVANPSFQITPWDQLQVLALSHLDFV